MLDTVINSPPKSSHGNPPGVLGLIHKINVKVPPCLMAVVGATVVAGVMEVDGFVVEAELQLIIDEAKISRMVTMMNSFFTVLPPFCFPFVLACSVFIPI
jgi:hypothetical protein